MQRNSSSRSSASMTRCPFALVALTEPRPRHLESTGVRFVAGADDGQQVIEQRVADFAELHQLLGGEQVEEMRSDAFDVIGRGGLQCGEAGVGEHGQRAAPIARATLAAHPSELFESGYRVTQAA